MKSENEDSLDTVLDPPRNKKSLIQESMHLDFRLDLYTEREETNTEIEISVFLISKKRVNRLETSVGRGH